MLEIRVYNIYIKRFNHEFRCKISVLIHYDIQIPVTEMCPDERKVMLDAVSRGDTVFVPRCNDDGTYASVQCHEYSGYCWCARLDGKVIDGTIEEGHQPDCSGNA